MSDPDVLIVQADSGETSLGWATLGEKRWRCTVGAGGVREDKVEGGEIVLREVTDGSLQVIADVLAKSVVLGYYEASLAAAFDAIEPFALGLKGDRRPTPKDRDLLRYIGDTLLTQHKMVGRVEVGEKPDVLWEQPGLNRLFTRLEEGRAHAVRFPDRDHGAGPGVPAR